VADYLEVGSRYDRAVEACLGDLLQHIIVERHEHATAGLELVRQHDAGRCGFVVVEPATNGHHPPARMRGDGVVPLTDVLRITGPHAPTIEKVLPDAYVAESFDHALAFAQETSAAVATLDGDVLRGAHLVSGGAKVESKGILATRREIKELRQRVDDDRAALLIAREDLDRIEAGIAATSAAITDLQAEQHRLEKEIVGFEAQLGRTADDSTRLARKADVIALERRRAEEEREALVTRRADAEASIGQLEQQQRELQERLGDAQRRLAETREMVARLAAAAAEARASHAALVERASALAAEVVRLEDGARELEQRISTHVSDLEQTRARHESVTTAIAEGERALAEEASALATVREELRVVEDAAAALRAQMEAQEVVIRDARRALEEVRAEANELEVVRATAEGDLTHLAQTCVDTVQCTLDEVFAEVERMEQAGEVDAARAAVAAVEPEAEETDEGEADSAEAAEEVGAAKAGEGRIASLTAEDAIAALKLKIERLGPVNILAIEQFDELETRHTFLTTQRKDLIESIAQTAEAIKRIDETSKARFNDAFTAIQGNFQQTFSTLFGGGHAGLTLIDENDPLESGIEIVASPPGKRLQSVQLLSGGEKALTAIALMFAIFKYKPSPFCLLDEIDAPLDDANVSRFVEMLRGMLDHTQFILITHNRRTMEIANRLYGVTMEEPGVSKLISVSLN
jgi:chromosome segregation protein